MQPADRVVVDRAAVLMTDEERRSVAAGIIRTGAIAQDDLPLNADGEPQLTPEQQTDLARRIVQAGAARRGELPLESAPPEQPQPIAASAQAILAAAEKRRRLGDFP